MKADCIIQARLGSTRFSGKILKDFGGKPLIQYIIDNLKQAKQIDRIILATTQNSLDDELCSYCDSHNIPYFRGSETNVLERFILTSENYHCEHIIRVCSDNPFIDIDMLDAQITRYFATKADYCTYAAKDGTPMILKPSGLFAEVVSLNALKRCFELATEKNHFEHVTFFIYNHPELFQIEKMPLGDDINPEFRFTIDYPDDLHFCLSIEKLLDGNVSATNIMKLMHENSNLQIANLDFARKHEKVY